MVVATTRALYADTDQMGVVNHAVALRWFELARAEWLRRLGHSYHQMEAEGMLLPVYELQVRYLKSARYDQVLLLDAVLQKPGPVRVIFDYKIFDSETKDLLISGSTHHAVIGRNGRPRRLTDAMMALLQRGKLADSESS
ncbi:MAG TPA: thioesterase family protein [Pseudomonadota bacterium]|nr:thioesterase family protein [Pseudomonadota bacterium]HNI58656.1 thioesterase family protein [Pseudomonadota bacterium]HNN50463.1 thioesterase family protein [Pseudomonadota bacterium]